MQSTASHPLSRAADRATGAGIIGAHTVEHVYTRGFIILIPHIAAAMGLSPIFAALIDGSRQLSAGFMGLSSGVLVDMYRHRRGQLLAIAMLILGVGYLLVSLVDNIYLLVIVGVMVGSAGSGLWHPPALGLLAERFPREKGLVISLHRSTGSLGDFVGPVVVGLLLLVISWQLVLQWGMILVLPLFVAIALFLRKTGTPASNGQGFLRNLTSQFRSTTRSFAGPNMASVIAVSAIRGMGDRALVLYLPFFMRQELGMGDVSVGLHVGLLAAMGIVAGPLFGLLSDRTGRKPVIVALMLISTVLPVAMVWSGGSVVFTATVVIFGVFFMSVNSLTQAAAIDLIEGKQLEGTAVGLMWGTNLAFGALSPLLAGGLAEIWGFGVAFYYVAALFFLAFLVALTMPSVNPHRSRPQ